MFNMGIQVEIKTFRTLIDTISNIKYQLLSTIVSYISSIFFNIYQLDQSTNVLATIILFKNVPSGPNSTLLSLFFLFCLLLSRSFLLSSRFLNLSFLRCCFDISTKESAVVFEYQSSIVNVLKVYPIKDHDIILTKYIDFILSLLLERWTPGGGCCCW